MRYWTYIAILALLAGCSGPKINLNANKLKSQQKQRVKAGNEQLKSQTGIEPEMTKRKTKFGLPTAPTD